MSGGDVLWDKLRALRRCAPTERAGAVPSRAQPEAWGAWGGGASLGHARGQLAGSRVAPARDPERGTGDTLRPESPGGLGASEAFLPFPTAALSGEETRRLTPAVPCSPVPRARSASLQSPRRRPPVSCPRPIPVSAGRRFIGDRVRDLNPDTEETSCVKAQALSSEKRSTHQMTSILAEGVTQERADGRAVYGRV